MEKSAFKKYLYLVLLIFTFLLICVYLIVCTPLVFYKKTGILVVSLTSHVLWTIFSYILNSTFEVEIDDKELEKIEDYENVIVISNHTGAFDFMVISEVSKRKRMLRHAKYMVKESIKYVPILGYVQYLGFMMLKRNFAKDESIIRNWLDYFCKNNVPFWLIIYPEGTRITPKKKAISDKFCDENNLQKLQNVLYPRTGGFKLSCECLKDHIKHVIDLTVYYENKHDLTVPSLLRFIFGMPEGKIKIKINVHELAKIEDYSEFVKEKFYEKDSLIQKWKETKNK